MNELFLERKLEVGCVKWLNFNTSLLPSNAINTAKRLAALPSKNLGP